MSLMSGIRRFSWCRFSKSPKKLRREFQVTSLQDSLGPDKLNGYVFNHLPTVTFPRLLRGDKAPAPLCTAQTRTAAEVGNAALALPGPVSFLHSRARSLLCFGSRGRFTSAPWGPLCPAAGSREPSSPPQQFPRPPRSHTDRARRPPRAPAPEALAPRLPGSEGHTCAGSMKAQFRFWHPSNSPPVLQNKQPLATARPPCAPASLVPAFGHAAAGRLSRGATGSTRPVSPAQRQRQAPPSWQCQDTRGGGSRQTGVSQARGRGLSQRLVTDCSRTPEHHHYNPLKKKKGHSTLQGYVPRHEALGGRAVGGTSRYLQQNPRDTWFYTANQSSRVTAPGLPSPSPGRRPPLAWC